MMQSDIFGPLVHQTYKAFIAHGNVTAISFLGGGNGCLLDWFAIQDIRKTIAIYNVFIYCNRRL